MKNNLKKILGAILGVVTLCFTLALTNINSAQAQEIIIDDGGGSGELYKPEICYLNNVPKAVCITPEKLGPCSLVKCE